VLCDHRFDNGSGNKCFQTLYNTVYTDSGSSGVSGAAELGPELYLVFGELSG